MLTGTQPYISPRSNSSIFTNSMFEVTLQNITITNNENQLFTEIKCTIVQATQENRNILF